MQISMIYNLSNLYFFSNFPREKQFDKEKYIVPQAHMELGLVVMLEGNKEEAKAILEKVLKDYSKYLSENIVHIKSYAALRALGVSTDKDAEEPGDDIENLDDVDVDSSDDDD